MLNRIHLAQFVCHFSECVICAGTLGSAKMFSANEGKERERKKKHQQMETESCNDIKIHKERK